MGELKMVPANTDREMAADFRKRLGEAFVSVLDIMNEARQAGLDIRWSIGPDEFGHCRVQHITIIRPL